MVESRVESDSSAADPSTANAPSAIGDASAQRLRMLLSGTRREVLARLVCGDPLQLGRRLALAMARVGVLVEVERAQLRAAARLAFEASHGLPPSGLEAWVQRQVDAAVLEGSEAPAGTGTPSDADVAPREGPLEEFARSLGLPEGAGPRLLDALNRCPEPERRAFLALAVQGGDLDALAHAQQTNASEIGRRARRALETLLRCLSTPSTAPIGQPAAGSTS